MTGTETVRIGADSAEAKAARSATGGASVAASGSTGVKAGKLAVELAPGGNGSTPARSLTVQVADQDKSKAAGLLAPLVSVTDAEPTDKPHTAKVTLDLKAMQAEGWADRARMVSLPGCALTTPQLPECRTQTPVASTLGADGKITAEVTFPTPTAERTATVKAGSAGVSETSGAPASGPAGAPSVLLSSAPSPSGAAGSFAATPLSPSSSWAGGSNLGNFTYAYPIQLPDALGGSKPAVSLGYNSAAVDGKTSATNSQSSWIGDGWGYESGFIERSYKPCDKAGIAGSTDQCWSGQNATLSLGSRSGTIVRNEKGAPETIGSWRLQEDDGSKVELLTGAPRTGTDQNYQGMEYWRITTSDGVQYYFGRNHLPEGDGTDPAANSVLTLPVYSPKSGDPCYSAATGTASWCRMAWRWQLDFVVDPYGNLTTYKYGTEDNKYSRGYFQNSNNGTTEPYQRAGYLREIGYGQRLSEQKAAKGALNPAAKVLFSIDERCFPAGSVTCQEDQRTPANAASWPDVPIDQICTGTSCTNFAPTFFTTKRLKEITTQVLVGGSYRTVDTYQLNQKMADPKDDTPKTLQLDSVKRLPSNGQASVDLPAVEFSYEMRPNRVDGLDASVPAKLFTRPRINGITTETGGRINVVYKEAECSRVAGRMPASEDGNTMACMPVKWYLPGQTGQPGQTSPDPVNDWFNKPVVMSVTEQDTVVSPSVARVTEYEYSAEGAAWHRNDSGAIDPKTRTWDGFRGYRSVITRTGNGNPDEAPKTQQKVTYIRGMHGDVKADDSLRSVEFTSPLGGTVTDHDWQAGRVVATEVYEQAGPNAQVKAVSGSTYSGEPVTAEQTVDGRVIKARYPADQVTAISKAKLANDTERTATVITKSDPAQGNRIMWVNDKGDGTAATPELCTTYTYAEPDNKSLTGLVSQQVTFQGNCSASATSANTLSGSRTLYDTDKPFNKAGDVGAPTGAQVLDRFDASGNPVYVDAGSQSYDVYGRSVRSSTTDGSAYDKDGNRISAPSVTPAVTTQAFTPATGTVPTEIRSTGPMGAGWVTTVTQDPGRGTPLTTTDVNGRVTTMRYDALGRVTAVWAPDRPTNEKASRKFSYFVNEKAPSVIVSESLDDDAFGYSASFNILDGLGRPRQTQQTSTSKPTGRLITDTVYDSHGWVIKTSAPYYEANSFPSRTLFQPSGDGQVPSQTWTSYDGQGRTVRQEFRSYGNAQWATTTAYPGADRVDATPPAGAAPSSTVTDARGRATELWQYRTPTATGNRADADVTTYSYTPAGLSAGRTDSSGNTWSYTYDLLGRQTSASDPDTGVTRTYYDANSRIDRTVDANGKTLAYTYDLLGRKTGLYKDSVAPANQLSGWTYDPVFKDQQGKEQQAKGQPAASIRYERGAPIVKSVTGYDTAYRPLGTSVDIPKGALPEEEAGLAQTYTTNYTYSPVLGLVKKLDLPAAGGLPAESITYARTVTGLVHFSESLGKAVVAKAEYDALARPVRTVMGEYGTQVTSTQQYDWATGRVINSFTDRQVGTASADQTSYTYTASGRITSTSTLQNASARDTQCFTYDHLGRLTRAWSDTGGTHTTADWTDSSGGVHGTGSSTTVPGTGGCNNATGPVATDPGNTSVGGPAPYWQDYTYDATGNRTSVTNHGSGAGLTLDATQITQVATAGDGNRTWTVALANGKLWIASQSADGSWSPFTDLMAQAGSLSTVSAVSAAVSNGRIQVMAIAGGKVWHTILGDKEWQKWGDVYSVVGSLSQPSQLALTATAAGLEVMTFSGGKLWHTVRMDSGQWQVQGWGDVYSVIGSISGATQMAASASAAGLEIAVGATGKLWHTVRRPDGQWQAQGWGDVYSVTGALPNQLTGQGQLALAKTNDGLQVVALANGKPWHVVRDSAGQWSSWADIAGATGSVTPPSSVAAAGIGAELKVVISGGGQLNQTTRSGAPHKWAAWSRIAVAAGTGSTTTQTFGPNRSVNTPTNAPNTGGGTGGPHALLTSTTTTSNGTKAIGYQYDAKGNTTAITDTGGTTSLTWNSEDRLASVARTGESGATTYVYDADGNQLIQRNPGKTTLNLPTDQLTIDTTTKSLSNVRTVGSFGGLTYTRVTAPIGGGNVVIQAADPHGTNDVQFNTDTSQTITRRPTDPFGNPRGTQPAPGAWAGNKGFVGGTKDDTTGLTNLGARQYDPTTGRFISPDPILDPAIPQQWNGYAYSENDPVNLSDPSGLKSEECGTLYDCKGKGTITMSNASETTSEYVSDSSLFRLIDSAPGYKPIVPIGPPPSKPKKRSFGAGVIDGFVGAAKGAANQFVQPFKDLKNCTVGMSGKACKAFALSTQPAYIAYTTAMDTYGGLETMYEQLKNGEYAYTGGEAAAMLIMAIAGRKVMKAAGKEPKAAGNPCLSFPAETLVLMADGSTKPIGEVVSGDVVTATDPQTSETSAQPVTYKTITPDDTRFTEVTLVTAGSASSQSSTETMVSTANHPYWDETSQAWVNAENLQTGHTLRSPDRDTVTVTAVHTYATPPTPAHNLTVDDLHTYYVLAGETPVLVHNATPGQKCDLTLGAGPNAREGVALVNGDIEALGVRELINEFGNAYGCHTCNATTPGTKYGDWIPDHQPPTSLVPLGFPQTAYPHCWTCARIQAGVVSQLSQARSKKAW